MVENLAQSRSKDQPPIPPVLLFRTMRKLIASLLFIFAGLAVLATQAAATSQSEDIKIEALLSYIGRQTNVKFIRNGTEYDCSAAAKFLRAKLEHRRSNIGSEREFIEKIASRSSTTGQTYSIRLTDGHQVDSATFLSNRLAELDQNEAKNRGPVTGS